MLKFLVMLIHIHLLEVSEARFLQIGLTVDHYIASLQTLFFN